MEFRISGTFMDSLARLTDQEQKLVKTTAFDLQMNPANPGFQFHRLENAKDPNFWSVRVNLDIRLIVHRTPESLLICYVGHHEDAYRWAQKRKLETHPKTGAAQIVEIRETVKEITIPQYLEPEKGTSKKLLPFEHISNEELLTYGVPVEWLNDVHQVDEEALLVLLEHLPEEAAEALLEIAVGSKPKPVLKPVAGSDPFSHPDAKRRFRIMGNMEELASALDFPWEKWTVFLHPDQRQIVEKDYGGPVRVSGSAGTGKTIVALHRAVFLARTNPDARILLTTFSGAMANALGTKLRRLINNEPRIGERLEIYAMNDIGKRIYELNFGRVRIICRDDIRKLLDDVAKKTEGHRFPSHFLLTEWEDVVDAWQIQSWEDYRDAKRLGRKTRLPERQRAILWDIFDQVRIHLQETNQITEPGIFSKVASHLAESKRKPFDFIVVDEAQDISVQQLRFLSAFISFENPNSIFFAGDLGQRIFQQPFSWKALGVDIRGRSRTLRVNYRTSHQIRMQADRLLGPELSDVDGNTEQRKGTISVFNGPKPIIMALGSENDEIQAVGKWITDKTAEGIKPHEIGVFVRSEAELTRAKTAVKNAGLEVIILDENVDTSFGKVSVSTMHLAKGLEFRVVVVMACDDEVIPLQKRIESVADDSDLEEVYNTERHLLYVACTRARDQLLVTSVDPASEFLDDMKG